MTRKQRKRMARIYAKQLNLEKIPSASKSSILCLECQFQHKMDYERYMASIV